MPFGHAPARLTIGSLDDIELSVTAHFNPHELGIKKTVPWSAGEHADSAKSNKKPKSNQDSHEFKGAATRSMALELLFDGYEDTTSVESIVETLETMSSVRDAGSSEAEMRRPHFCVVAWGEEGVKPFRCIITSLAVRYTMFAPNGQPLRAVCSVELAEARIQSAGATVSAVRDVGRALARAAGF